MQRQPTGFTVRPWGFAPVFSQRLLVSSSLNRQLKNAGEKQQGKAAHDNSTGEKSTEEPEEDEEPGIRGKIKRLKKLAKTYGLPFLIYWHFWYFLSLGGVYYVLYLDVIPWASIVEVLKWMTNSPLVD